MLKHYREYFRKNEVRGQVPSALFFIKHKLGDAFTDLQNFLVVWLHHTLALMINMRFMNY